MARKSRKHLFPAYRRKLLSSTALMVLASLGTVTAGLPKNFSA